jgi:ribosomal protein S27AE
MAKKIKYGNVGKEVQKKKVKLCGRCDNEMVWAKIEGRKMKWWCNKCGLIET